MSLFLLTRATPTIQISGAVPSSEEPLGLGVKTWFFQTERGLSPKPQASEEEAISSLPTPPGQLSSQKIKGKAPNVRRT